MFLFNRSAMIGIGFLILLTACGGGGGGPDNNTIPLPSDAIDITGAMPYADSVSTLSGNKYGISGLSPNSVYTISLQRSVGLARVQVPDTTSDSDIQCGTNNAASLALIQCSMRSDISGNIVFQALAESEGANADFSLNITEGGTVNEGTAVAPVELNSFPSIGGLLSQSYYKITGLNSDAAYTFSIANTTGNAQLSIYKAEFGSIVTCTLLTSSGSTSCIIKSTINGEVYVRADSRIVPNMSGFEISIDEYLGSSYISEGSISSPLDIGSSLPYSGEVGPSDNSYYTVSGLLADTIYTVALQRSAGAATLIVSNAASGGSINCGWNNNAPNLLIECAARTDANGSLGITVGRVTGEAGGQYQLSLTQGGVINEGSSNSPVEISSFPATGGALLQSFYKATGLTPNSNYTVSVSNFTGDVAFFFYPSALYQQEPSICVFNLALDPNSACAVTADDSGAIYFMSNIQNDIYGVEYTMELAAGGLANQGTSLDPVVITNSLPYSGTVHLNWSYYLVEALTLSSPYTVSLSNITDNVKIILYGEGRNLNQQIWRTDCSKSLTGLTIGECVASADTAGTLMIGVGGFQSTSGAEFDIGVAPGGLPNEGYFGWPRDITGSLPHSGTIYNSVSIYKIVQLTEGATYTINLTNLSSNLRLAVYRDADHTDLLCESNNSGTTDESCAAVAPANGEIHIRVMASTAISGASFMLDVN